MRNESLLSGRNVCWDCLLCRMLTLMSHGHGEYADERQTDRRTDARPMHYTAYSLTRLTAIERGQMRASAGGRDDLKKSSIATCQTFEHLAMLIVETVPRVRTRRLTAFECRLGLAIVSLCHDTAPLPPSTNTGDPFERCD